MAIARQNSRLWKNVALVLCLWQSLVFVLAGLCFLFGLGAQVPLLSDSERREITSLLHPTDNDRQQSLSEVGKLIGTHRRAVQLWQEAIYHLLAGRNSESVLSNLEAQASRAPKFYDKYTRWLLTDLWRKSRGELIITAAGYGCTNEIVLAEIGSLRQELSAEKEAARYSYDAESLALILQANYSGAARSMSSGPTVFIEPEEMSSIKATLSRLEQAPTDFERRLELAESLFGFAGSGRFTVGYTSYCWNLWDEASTLDRRVSVLHLLGRIYDRDDDVETTRMLYSAAARLAFGSPAMDPNRLALLIAGVADAERKSSRYLLAASLYQEVAGRTRDIGIWGTSTFNHGSLLREAGYGRAAITVLSELIESNVHDQDPSGNLTETFQNYRNRAARLIAVIFRDRGNLPMQYYWRYKTAQQYPFHTRSGTDLESYRREETTDLLLGSIQAGPIFFAANLIIFPIRNWPIWFLVLLGIVWKWRAERKTRQKQ